MLLRRERRLVRGFDYLILIWFDVVYIRNAKFGFIYFFLSKILSVPFWFKIFSFVIVINDTLNGLKEGTCEIFICMSPKKCDAKITKLISGYEICLLTFGCLIFILKGTEILS